MKWIGAHIWDWVTRFRNDVYIENISEVSQDHVIGIDADGKLTKFDTPVPGTGGSTLDSDITVTNLDGGFSHIAGDTISASTTITNVLDSILTPYNNTTITLNSVIFAKLAAESSWETPAVSLTGDIDVETGQDFRVTELTYNVATPTQTSDTSVDFMVGASQIPGFQNGADDNTSSQSLSPAYTVVNDAVASELGDVYALNVVATDSGGAGSVVIQSNYINVTVKNRVKIGGSSVSSVASISEAKTLWDGISDAYSELAIKGDITAVVDEGMDRLQYTWVIYPNAWGSLSNITHNNGQSVLSDFEAPVSFSIENVFGTSVTCKLYRSTYVGAFAENSTLKISF